MSFFQSENPRYKKGLGIPYKGSKRKLASKIVDYILLENPKTKYVYDLFGGGGAMSFELIQRPQIKKVFYNELNTGVVSLLKDIQENGVTDKYYKWIDRETFHKYKNDDDWFGGLVKTCWSFGNDQKTYLFSPEKEKFKQLLHNIIIYRDPKSIQLFEDKYNFKLDKKLLDNTLVSTRRLTITSLLKGRNEQLERLQQLEQLQQLERLTISNMSYENVSIKTPLEETLVYLDPPYLNTNEYQLSIDQGELIDYIKKSKYKIYISSYDFPFNLKKSFEHRCTLSSIVNNKVTENLYCNR